MSHIVTIQTKVRDVEAIRFACRRLSLCDPYHGTAKLYTSQATGWIINFPTWQYPVVCEVESGNLLYDNFEGRWGSITDVHRFLQAYAVEKTKLEARKAGHTAYELPLEDGSVRVTVQLAAV